MQDFELSFSAFIDSDCKEYDQAHAALFSLARIAFKEGWLAAGGEPPQTRKGDTVAWDKVCTLTEW